MSRPSITGNCVFKWTLLQSGWAKEPASSWLRHFTALGQRFAHLSGKAMAVPAEGPLASEGLRSQVSRSPVSSPSPQYVFFCSSWPQSEAQLPAHSFLGQIEERTLRVQRPSPPPAPDFWGRARMCAEYNLRCCCYSAGRKTRKKSEGRRYCLGTICVCNFPHRFFL